MKPILFSLGPFHLYSFGVTVAAGVLLSLLLMTRRAQRDGFPRPDDVFDLVFVVVAFGFLGARLFYVFQNFEGYRAHPLSIFAIWEGGLIFYGGVMGALVALFVFMKIRGIPFLKGLDFLLPYESLAHGFGRIGCFFNGCCGGRLCSLPWGVKFPGSAFPTHPTQLYEAAFDFAFFFFLNARTARKKFDGEISGLYFMTYAVARFVIEFYREGNPGWIFTWNQWLSLGVFLIAFSLMISKRRLLRRPTASSQ